MAKIVTLKDNITEESVYPQTKAAATYMDNGDTVENIVGMPIELLATNVLSYAIIQSSGSLVQNGNGAYLFRVLVEENKTYKVTGRVVVNTGSSLRYAFYNSESTQDASTFISGGELLTGYDTGFGKNETYLAKAPAGAKSLVAVVSSLLGIYEIAGLPTLVDIVDGLVQQVGDLQEDVETLSGNGITTKQVTNGEETVICNTETIDSRGYISEKNIEQDYFIYNNPNNDYGWAASPIFQSSNPKVLISFKVETLSGTPGYDIQLGKSQSALDPYATLKTITTDGEYNIVFDATYYAIYRGYTQFSVWFNNRAQPVNAKVSNFKVYEFSGQTAFANIEGNNVNELFVSVDEKLSADDISEQYLVSPNGGKYYLSVSNTGVLSARSVIPSKGVFFGNSLLAGNVKTDSTKFGMAASDDTKDYYALMNGLFVTLNPSYTQSRIGAAGFETISQSVTMAQAFQTYFSPYLTGNEDFIGIQLGDNVAAGNVSWWLEYARYVILAIKNVCQSARIVWFGVWYGSSKKIDGLRSICHDTGCLFVNIYDLYKPENWGGLGNLIELGQAERTLSGVINVVENSSTNITVSFVYNGMAGESTIDVVSYSLSDNVLTYTSNYKIITVEYSHPGDLGFKRISNKLAYAMGLTDNISYFG